MMFLRFGMFLAFAGAMPAHADISVEAGLLPFGWPTEVNKLQSREGSVLSRQELARCIEWQQEMYQADVDLRLERTILMADQAGAQLEKFRNNTENKQQDDTDRQLDEIEKALKAADPGVEQRIVNHIIKRQGYFHNFSDFIENCGTRPYRLEDLHVLTGKQ